jgi:tetratricopeptide (TPR) repeat protein
VPRALSILVAIMLAAMPAVADDRDVCDKGTGEAAIAACSRAIASGHYSGIDLAKLHTNRGVEFKRQGNLDAAIADYDAATALNPSDPFAYNNRANAWRDKGDLARAIADYGEAIRLDPGYTAAYVNRGLVYERTQDIAQARADYEQALALPPKYANGPGGREIARRRLAALARTP